MAVAARCAKQGSEFLFKVNPDSIYARMTEDILENNRLVTVALIMTTYGTIVRCMKSVRSYYCIFETSVVQMHCSLAKSDRVLFDGKTYSKAPFQECLRLPLFRKKHVLIIVFKMHVHKK